MYDFIVQIAKVCPRVTPVYAAPSLSPPPLTGGGSVSLYPCQNSEIKDYDRKSDYR